MAPGRENGRVAASATTQIIRGFPEKAGRDGEAIPSGLALGELEPAPGALLSVLLPLVLTGIPSQKSELLQLAAQFGVELDQRAGDAEPGSACLTGQSAAVGENQNVELIGGLGSQQRLAHDVPRGVVHEIVFKRSSVDLNLALTRTQKDTRDRRLAPACS
jgi:hypothetical protein